MLPNWSKALSDTSKMIRESDQTTYQEEVRFVSFKKRRINGRGDLIADKEVIMEKTKPGSSQRCTAEEQKAGNGHKHRKAKFQLVKEKILHNEGR